MSHNEELYSILNAKGFINILQCTEYLYHGGYPLKEALYISKNLFPDTLSIDPMKYQETTDPFYNAFYFLTSINDAWITSYGNPNSIHWNKNGEKIVEMDLAENRILIRTSVLSTLPTWRDNNDWKTHVGNLINKVYNLNFAHVRAF